MAQEPTRNQPILTAEQLRGRLSEFYRALDEFNDGYYFESHETLEDLWLVAPWPERQLFQGVIQLAAAFVHFFRGEYPGTMKLLDAAVEKLRALQPERLGVDLAALVSDVERCRTDLAALGRECFQSWDPSGIPVVRFKRFGDAGSSADAVGWRI
jgi:uncharacterized protein